MHPEIPQVSRDSLSTNQYHGMLASLQMEASSPAQLKLAAGLQGCCYGESGDSSNDTHGTIGH